MVSQRVKTVLWGIYFLVLLYGLTRPESVNAVLVVTIITAIYMMISGRKRGKREGWIYLIQDPHTGQYKIGLTRRRTVSERIYEQTKGPTPYKLIHTIPTDDVFRAEGILHEEFEEFRRRGEWFELSTAQRKRICAIKRL